MRVLGRVAAALATSVVLVSASVGAVEAVETAPRVLDPYSSRINTKTTVTTPTPIKTNTNVLISVKVTANSPEQPTGTVTLTLHSSPGSSGQSLPAAADLDGWSRTIDYDGGTEQVRGPAFPKVSTWGVTAVFHPADNTFRGSRDSWVFKVVAGDGDNPDDNDDNGGLLPDTGGPALLWLLLGVGLVGGGAGAVVVSRRRRETVQPAV